MTALWTIAGFALICVALFLIERSIENAHREWVERQREEDADDARWWPR